MFRFIKLIFLGLLSVCTIGHFRKSLVSNLKEPIKCVSLNNHLCQAIPRLININSDETLLCPFTVSINKCGGSYNTIEDPYARVFFSK